VIGYIGKADGDRNRSVASDSLRSIGFLSAEALHGQHGGVTGWAWITRSQAPSGSPQGEAAGRDPQAG
jgi:hypothetical protein